jgi:hypothetical protein
MGRNRRKNMNAESAKVPPLVPVEGSETELPTQAAAPEGKVPPKNVPEHPHWSTYIAPLVSVLVAALSLLTTWYVFLKTAETNRNNARPYVTFSFTQESPLGALRSEKPVVNKHGAVGVVTLINGGNTAAYNITTVISNSKLTCSATQKNIVVLPHTFTKYRIFCSGNDDAVIKPDIFGVYPIEGSITYHDINGYGFTEPIT